jgi:hypothetical protein
VVLYATIATFALNTELEVEADSCLDSEVDLNADSSLYSELYHKWE